MFFVLMKFREGTYFIKRNCFIKLLEGPVLLKGILEEGCFKMEFCEEALNFAWIDAYSICQQIQ